jgi:trehalose synthase
MVGFFLAHDDPEAMKVFRAVEKEAKKHPSIFLFSDPDWLGSLKVDSFVNAVQVASDIIIQNSVREGFGLSLTEAMWKEKPVIARNAGGLKLQIENGKNGFLVNNHEELAERIAEILKNPAKAKKLGREAKKTVKRRFLIPRLLRDYLRVIRRLTLPGENSKPEGGKEVMGVKIAY